MRPDIHLGLGLPPRLILILRSKAGVIVMAGGKMPKMGKIQMQLSRYVIFVQYIT